MKTMKVCGILAVAMSMVWTGCEWSSGGRDAGQANAATKNVQPAVDERVAAPTKTVVESPEPVELDSHPNAGEIAVEHMDERNVDHLEIAKRLSAEGDEAAAMLQLGKALFDDDENYQAAVRLGKIALNFGKTELARKAFLVASRIDVQDPEPWIKLARLDLVGHDLDQARQDATRALAIDKQAAEAYNVIGRVWISRSEWEKAILTLKKAVALEPQNRYFRNNLGFAYLLRKDFAKAIEQLELAVRGEGAPAYMHNNLGLAYEGAGRLNEAISVFGKLVASHPRYLKARLNHDRLMLLAKRTPDAAGSEQQASDSNDDQEQEDLIVPETE